MSTASKILSSAVAVAIAGVATFEACRANRLRATIRNRQAELSAAKTVDELRRERNEISRGLAALQQDNERLQRSRTELLALRGKVTQLRNESLELGAGKGAAAEAGPNDTGKPQETVVDWRPAVVSQLKEALDRMPERRIPELRYLGEADWLNAAQSASLETDDQIRQALCNVRVRAKIYFSRLLQEALKSYTTASDGRLPTDLAQLKQYFSPPVDDALLQRYQLLQTGPAGSLAPGQPWAAEKQPVDDDHDQLIRIGMTTISFKQVSAQEREWQALLRLAR